MPETDWRALFRDAHDSMQHWQAQCKAWERTANSYRQSWFDHQHELTMWKQEWWTLLKRFDRAVRLIGTLRESRTYWAGRYYAEKRARVTAETVRQWTQNPRDYEYRAAMHRSEDYFTKWSTVSNTLDEVAELHKPMFVGANNLDVCTSCRSEAYPCRTARLIKPPNKIELLTDDEHEYEHPWGEAVHVLQEMKKNGDDN